MIELTRSRFALTFAGIAAGFGALGYALSVVGYAVLSQSSISVSRNLITAGTWVLFAGAFAVLVGVGSVAWSYVLAGRYRDVWEPASAMGASLLYALGGLLLAAEVSNSSDAAGRVVTALGIGAWAVVAVVIAAVRSVAESKVPSGQRVSGYWLAAGGALALLAISMGISDPTAFDSTPGIVRAVIGALGFTGFATLLGVARGRHVITTRAFPAVAAGLVVLAVWQVALAVSSAIVFSPTSSVTTVRIGLSVPEGVAVLGMVLLASAAWRRVAEVPQHVGPVASARGQEMPFGFPSGYVPPSPRSSAPGSGAYAPPPGGIAPSATGPEFPNPAAEHGAPGWKAVTHCGVPLPGGAVFCPRCGTRVTT